MNFQQILNNLREGKKLEATFPHAKAREQFRVQLYRAKKTEDEALKAVLDEERLTLKWEPEEEHKEIDGNFDTIFKAKFWLEVKPTEEDFEIKILE